MIEQLPAPARDERDQSVSTALDLIADPAVPIQTPTVHRTYLRFRGEQGSRVEEPVIAEIRLRIEVDGRELVELMCSPHRVNALVLGFLYHEGLIDSQDDVRAIRVCLPDGLVEVWLARSAPELPSRKIVTSGCTGGVSFGAYLDELERLTLPPDDVRVPPQRLYDGLRQLYDNSALYNLSGGVHTSVLLDPTIPAREPHSILAVGEDIGRHNTLDKLRGEAMLRGLDTRGAMIVASGRISSEMLIKAAMLGVPIVGSRTSPTQLAVSLAERLNLTVIGYIRSASMNVYTHPERILGSSAS